jgi:branched-chain amino acid transport system substrate-binding protein
VALSAALLTPGAASFAESVGYPNPVFGLDDTARSHWGPVADRIRARAGMEPDAFALAVYDAVWIAAESYLSLGPQATTEELHEHFVANAARHYGTTGWTLLNDAGDRAVADFDFWAVRNLAGSRVWKRVASFDTRLGTLTRY